MKGSSNVTMHFTPGAGRLSLVLGRVVKGHRSEGRVSDDQVSDDWVANVLGKCHGHDRFHGYSYGRAMLWP